MDRGNPTTHHDRGGPRPGREHGLLGEEPRRSSFGTWCHCCCSEHAFALVRRAEEGEPASGWPAGAHPGARLGACAPPVALMAAVMTGHVTRGRGRASPSGSTGACASRLRAKVDGTALLALRTLRIMLAGGAHRRARRQVQYGQTVGSTAGTTRRCPGEMLRSGWPRRTSVQRLRRACPCQRRRTGEPGGPARWPRGVRGGRARVTDSAPRPGEACGPDAGGTAGTRPMAGCRDPAWTAARRLEDKAPGRVEKIRPAFTSQRCSACGHVDAESRESQARFVCTACGFADHADVNAARNIAAGHAVTARGGDGVARPVNREPQLLLQSA